MRRAAKKIDRLKAEIRTINWRETVVTRVLPLMFGAAVWCGCIGGFVVQLGQMP